MIKVFRFAALCAITVAFATSSIAWAQAYTTVGYPGAIATTLNGGPDGHALFTLLCRRIRPRSTTR